MIDAVLFDWGDTLSSVPWSEEIARKGSLAGLKAMGERSDLLDVEAIAAYLADPANPLSDPDREDAADLAALMDEYFASSGARHTDEQLDNYLAASHELWHGHAFVHPASHALLESLRARGLKLAVVSNVVTPPRFVRHELEREGLAPRVDAIVLSCEVGKRKPHPAMFERALAELGVRAEDAVFVGDRLLHDIKGAGQLGMTTIQALWFRADEHANGGKPDFQAFTQMDVLNVVRRLTGKR
jgi:HAD superfamily hydrolase (TIGR01662 family)